MQLFSDIRRDAGHPKPSVGSYEWWYFDGISEDGRYQFVIIFYEGCPFSTRYIQQLEQGDSDREKLAEHHPAISISVYDRGKPIFYSLSQYPAEECRFDYKTASVRIGENSMRFSERMEHGSRGVSSFDLRINEQLPSGDALKGIVTFFGIDPYEKLLSSSSETDPVTDGHWWNLVFPRARMQSRMNLISKGIIQKELAFEGLGYHDHNLGTQPMKEAFRDWYWGRVHFSQATLIYYVMHKREKGQDYRAWLVSPDNRRLLYTLKLEELKKHRSNGFFLQSARRLVFAEQKLKIQVDHLRTIDSGPFYCRYRTQATLTHPALGELKQDGIGEYIRPARIYQRRYWPLVRMRIRYTDSKPHWVQKKPRLYRWTW